MVALGAHTFDCKLDLLSRLSSYGFLGRVDSIGLVALHGAQCVSDIIGCHKQLHAANAISGADWVAVCQALHDKQHV